MRLTIATILTCIVGIFMPASASADGYDTCPDGSASTFVDLSGFDQWTPPPLAEFDVYTMIVIGDSNQHYDVTGNPTGTFWMDELYGDGPHAHVCVARALPSPTTTTSITTDTTPDQPAPEPEPEPDEVGVAERQCIDVTSGELIPCDTEFCVPSPDDPTVGADRYTNQLCDTGVTTTTICTEDMPCWDCETMGNQQCGPVETDPPPTLPTTGGGRVTGFEAAIAALLCLIGLGSLLIARRPH